MSAGHALVLRQLAAHLREEARICDTWFEANVMEAAAAEIERVLAEVPRDGRL